MKKTFILACSMLALYVGNVEAGPTSKTVQLTGMATNADQFPRFKCEGSSDISMPYQAGTISGVGKIAQNNCTVSLGITALNRNVDLQAIAQDGSNVQEADYQINTVTGSIQGAGVLGQNSRRYSLPTGQKGVMNYGVSHASSPINDQAYIYTGADQSGWMGNLISQYPDLKFSDLVLPGAHDAGMYTVSDADTQAAIGEFCTSYSILQKLCSVGVTPGMQALANFSVTQKDTSDVQMASGTRYFDFRPAYLKSDSTKTAYHVHNFITGAQFGAFLDGINSFMSANTQEVALLQIKDSGIDSSKFQFLSQSDVQAYLQAHITADVGFNLVTDVTPYHAQALKDIAASKQRLIVLYGNSNVNDSYGDTAYSTSLTDASTIIAAMGKTASTTGNFQFTMLQMQDTGSGALVNNYVSTILSDLPSWANNLLLSATGNILQATKPLFDSQTYPWIVSDAATAGIKSQTVPVVTLNDFVDVGLSSNAIALTEMRYKNRTGK